ncbi:MAG: winged helix-turn-helix transcriptional regulator [Erysipelotrichaceae bacterium]|nr:winged helix-turn-helix transcriptional regulator [Erysipelotrichaceae bacterium]
MIIGYARVSTVTQNEDRQMEALKSYGCEKIYLDKLSGKDTKRPELQKMLNYVREGDTVIVTEFSRFSRSTRDLLSLVEQLTEKNVDFKSIKESVDTTTSTGRLVLTIFAALAEFERAVILERQAEGIAIAKAKGKSLGRRQKVLDDEKLIEMYNEWKENLIYQKKILKEFGISRTTLNKHINRLAKEGKITKPEEIKRGALSSRKG